MNVCLVTSEQTNENLYKFYEPKGKSKCLRMSLATKESALIPYTGQYSISVIENIEGGLRKVTLCKMN